MKALTVFLGGAAVGAITALLFAPESGEDLRYRIKTLLKKKGIIKPDQIDILAARIVAEIEQEQG